MEYLMCTIQEEHYAIAAQHIQEILPMMWINRIPDAPSLLEGMLNLRGTMISIIDLSKRIGLTRDSYPYHARIVIIQLPKWEFGLIIDKVHDIQIFNEDQKKEGVLNAQEISFVHQVLVGQEKMIQILMPEYILSESEKKYLKEVKHG